MEKHLKTLENNVQWIALGLGGIYLLWMVYAYVITPPVTVKLDKSASAAAITPGDVDDTIAKKDAEPLKMAMSRSDTLDIKVTDVMGPYLARIDEKDLKTPDLATAWGGVRGEVPGVTLEGPGKNVVIADAPVPPKAIPVASSSNIASIVLSNPAAPNGNNVVPAGQALPPHKDTGWCSWTFKVPFADLKKAWEVFDNPNVPGFQSLFNTQFLKVTLTRQEMLPNGQWGNQKDIDPVGIAGTRQFPGAELPNANNAQRQEAFEYKQWAGSVAQEITQPTFPEVIPGVRVWYAPGEAPPDPTKKQRNGRFGMMPHRAPPPPIPAAPQNQNQNQWAAGQGQAAQPGVGQFNVMNLNQDLELMAHDITAEPGHTYRYRIQYALANPTWDSANLAVPNVANQFALVSQPSDWTQPVTIPSTTQMFVVNVSSQTQRVQFDVFEWKDGKMNRSTVTATPGDAIKDETVVDIRQDAGKHDASYVLLVGPNGNLSRQDKQGDAANPDYDKLKAEVALQQEQQGGPFGRQQAFAR